MKFLLDENVSPLLVDLLTAGGHDATHVRDLGRSGATDETLFALAAAQKLVIISADTDFGDLLARTNAAGPSVILLRRQSSRRAAQIAALLLANLDTVSDDLDAGAIVVFDEDRIRIRSLPIHP